MLKTLNFNIKNEIQMLSAFSFGKILVNNEDVKNQFQIDLSIKRVDKLIYEYKNTLKYRQLKSVP